MMRAVECHQKTDVIISMFEKDAVQRKLGEGARVYAGRLRGCCSKASSGGNSACSHDGINYGFKFHFRDVCGLPESGFEPCVGGICGLRQSVSTGRPFSIGTPLFWCRSRGKRRNEALINPKAPFSLLKSLGGRRADGVAGPRGIYRSTLWEGRKKSGM